MIESIDGEDRSSTRVNGLRLCGLARVAFAGAHPRCSIPRFRQAPVMTLARRVLIERDIHAIDESFLQPLCNNLEEGTPIEFQEGRSPKEINPKLRIYKGSNTWYQSSVSLPFHSHPSSLHSSPKQFPQLLKRSLPNSVVISTTVDHPLIFPNLEEGTPIEFQGGRSPKEINPKLRICKDSTMASIITSEVRKSSKFEVLVVQKKPNHGALKQENTLTLE
ncbi:hypothetical protein C4D60_Mb09t17780 [Musa balbisiana]|uniref:Uncharacterized protein n=1 Tax=Musa balbisiana TaxID=52838 RepID=A0A4S8IIJ5_MUSBA|nr:hypothetical protein C4D60_Mb09t17780 [Musa balbisiana]